MKNHSNDSSADNRLVPNTSAYRRTLKKMVERTRTFLLMSGANTQNIPRGVQGKPMPESPEKIRKQFEEAKKRTLTVRTLHYFAHPISNLRDATRSEQDSTPAASAVSAT
jgi:hypothetical protein